MTTRLFFLIICFTSGLLLSSGAHEPSRDAPSPRFKVSASPSLDRPLILLTTKKRDANGRLPHDVVSEFLNDCAVGDYKSMTSHLYPRNIASEDAARSRFYKAVSERTKSIVHQEFSTKQKADNFRVIYELVDIDGAIVRGDFYLKMHEGAYKITAKEHWVDPEWPSRKW